MIHHVTCYTGPDPDEDTTRRMRMARWSWANEQLQAPGFYEWTGTFGVRRAKEGMPFVRDLIDVAVERGSGPHDVVFVTNADVGFFSGIAKMIDGAIAQGGACHMRRREYTRIDDPYPFLGDSAGLYSGMDGFAFTRMWWSKYGHLFPDMILGRYGWDSCMRNLIRRTGGVEVKNALWHETHAAHWNSSPEAILNDPGNVHNRSLLTGWIEMYGGNCEDHLFTDEQLRFK